MLALFVEVPTMYRLQKTRSPFADPKYSADHGPLPQSAHLRWSRHINKLNGEYVKINCQRVVRVGSRIFQ